MYKNVREMYCKIVWNLIFKDGTIIEFKLIVQQIVELIEIYQTALK